MLVSVPPNAAPTQASATPSAPKRKQASSNRSHNGKAVVVTPVTAPQGLPALFERAHQPPSEAEIVRLAGFLRERGERVEAVIDERGALERPAVKEFVVARKESRS